MPERLVALLDAYPFGDLASIAGLLVALIGFTATIWAAWRSKTAAEAAAEAATTARDDVLAFQSTMNLASVVSEIEGLKPMHRAGRWAELPDRYSTICAALASIRSRNPSLTRAHDARIQLAITELRRIEHRIDASLVGAGDAIDVAALNRVVSELLDELRLTLHELEPRPGARTSL